MKETISYRTKGTCSREIHIELEDNIILNIDFVGGCHGNLQGISSLVRGMNINDVIKRLRGINCGDKRTSCPDQLAVCLEEYVKAQKVKQTV